MHTSAVICDVARTVMFLQNEMTTEMFCLSNKL
jgi:hypothetical protein